MKLPLVRTKKSYLTDLRDPLPIILRCIVSILACFVERSGELCREGRDVNANGGSGREREIKGGKVN